MPIQAGQWAKQQKKGLEAQERQGDPKAGERHEPDRVLSEGAPGDNRTPSDPIGEVAYASGGSADESVEKDSKRKN